MKDVFTVKRSADGDDVLKKLNNPFVNVITTGDANYALEDIESGYVIVEAAATEARTITLPAPSSGLYFKVIWGIASDAAETIITAKAAADLFKGQVQWIDSDTDTGGETFDLQSDFSDDRILTVHDDIEPGSWVEFVSDGTYWYVSGLISATVTPAFS